MALAGGRSTRHYEGAFMYPRYGIGQIADRLGEACGREHISTSSRVTGLRCERQRLVSVELNHLTSLRVHQVISTIPVETMLRAIDPQPPVEVLEAAKRLRYRNLILVAVCLDKPSVTPCATVYFPDPEVPFTRVSEPRNRSSRMAPDGKTSLLIEIPCDASDPLWRAPEAAVVAAATAPLMRIGWFTSAEMLAAHVVRIGHAYPVMALGLDESLTTITSFLRGITNLRLVGRNAQFRYTWIHELIRAGKQAVDEIA
jgi:protoporphyrinogen oxidase